MTSRGLHTKIRIILNVVAQNTIPNLFTGKRVCNLWVLKWKLINERVQNLAKVIELTGNFNFEKLKGICIKCNRSVENLLRLKNEVSSYRAHKRFKCEDNACIYTGLTVSHPQCTWRETIGQQSSIRATQKIRQSLTCLLLSQWKSKNSRT